MIRKLFAFGLAVVLALMPVQTFGKTVSITNVSYVGKLSAAPTAD